MAVSFYKRGVNYASTYLLLVKDYASFLGWRAIAIVGGVVLAGLLYPLPFAIMAAAVYTMMAGQETSIIRVMGWHIEISVDRMFLYALIFAGATLTLQFVATRTALISTSAWQTSLYWRAVNQLPRIARWDLDMIIPMPITLGSAGGFLNAIVRSGFLIGIVVIGLSNVVIFLGGTIVLAWLDPVSVALLIVIAILFLPAYAWAMLQLIGGKQRRLRMQRDQRTLLKRVLEEVLSGTGRQIDTGKMIEKDMRRFEAGYGTVNAQLQGLNLITFISGVQVFVSIAIIYLVNGASFATFIRDKIVFFAILIFVMRAALALAALMARLSRNYANLATLRAYLHPRRKRLNLLPGAPANTVFALTNPGDGTRHALRTGSPVFVVMPSASRAYELLPLSNALEIVKSPAPKVLRHIAFIDSHEFLATRGCKVQTSVIRIPHEKQDLELPVRHMKPQPDELGVVALTFEAWRSLVNNGTADEYCRDRIVFVILAEPKIPKPPSSKTLLVVSDRLNILAVGSFSEIWDARASEAFKRASKGKKRVELEGDEDL